MSLRGLVAATLAGFAPWVSPEVAIGEEPSPEPAQVETARVPRGGIQPRVAVDGEGALHMVYFRGEPEAGDLFYVRREPAGDSFSAPVRVNSQEGSAVAVGTIRGAQIALGEDGRLHVVWNGSRRARPRGLPNPELPEGHPHKRSAPLLYARMEEDGGFGAQRNLMQRTYALDGGASVASDGEGRVWAVWHANGTGGPKGEGGRAVWVATSTDGGATFAKERRINPRDTGACPCCALNAFADETGRLHVLYRSARAVLHRDMYHLVAPGASGRFESARIDRWRVPKCVMSSSGFCERQGEVLAAWETEGQVYLAAVGSAGTVSEPVPAPGAAGSRKHPVLAANERGEVILAWTEGTGWNRGGKVAWQVFDAHGRPLPGRSGRVDGLEAWSFPAVFAREDGGFTVLY